MTTGERAPDCPIAIVGMAARVPGAGDVDRLWDNLCAGVESVEPLDRATLLARGIPVQTLDDPNYRMVTATAAALDEFDPEFFGFTPREAELCDPQFRLFLELAYSALWHAGYRAPSLNGRVGVFGGATANTYRDEYIERNRVVSRAAGITSIRTGTNPDYIAPLVSYKLGFMGPSVSVYTACSTALVAVHQAVLSLRRGECDVALAGGVQVDLPLGGGYDYREGGIHSRDGRVRPFSAEASGTIFADGGGVVMLKPLAAAVEAGDTVYATVVGSAVNNDGNRRAGFTAPGMDGQIELLRAALADARVDPRHIGLVEAHGTGTVVGDPIEVGALARVYSAGTDERGWCRIGSAKGNVGHLGPAAGAIGLIKAALAVFHGTIPPTINWDPVNPALELEQTPFLLASSCQPWPAGPGPRQAAVSSFGIGGTNGHVIVREPPAPSASDASGPWLVPVSARSATALDALCTAAASWLDRSPEALADAAFTLQEGRPSFAVRRVAIGSDAAEVAAALSGAEPSLAPLPGVRGVAFLFPGQGAQYPGLGRGLYEGYPVYRDAVDACTAVLARDHGLDLRALLVDAAADDDEAASALNETANTQPAIFVVEWALAQLWQSFGVVPAAMLGHSIGEITAATLAGVFTLEDALGLVAARGRLMQAQPRGSMLAVPLGADALRPMLPPELDLAASNSPSASVVSGTDDAVRDFAAELDSIGLTGVVLRTSHAFHSRLMDAAADEFERAVAEVPRKPPHLPYLSNVTGDWIEAEQAMSPRYWAAHLRGEVRFDQAVGNLLERSGLALLEVGPGQALSGFAREHAVAAGATVATLPSLGGRRLSDVTAVLRAAGRLWASGVELDWSGARAGRRGRRIALPGYPYERRRCWVDPDPVRSGGDRDDEVSSDPLRTPLYVPAWQARPRLGRGRQLLGEAWLVIGEPGALADAVCRSAHDDGVYVLRADMAEAFADTIDGLEFQPDDPADVEQLVASVWQRGLWPDRIVYLTGPLDGPDVVGVARRTYARLASLAKALIAAGPSRFELVLVADRIWSVNGEPSNPAGATGLGPLWTLPRELTTTAVRLVDVDARGPDEQVGRSVVDEIGAGSDDHLVALRGRRRWVHEYAAVPNRPVPAHESPVRPGGVYLITGGLGGLGLVLAEQLVEQARARLVLVGRQPVPPPSTWDELIAAPATDAATRHKLTTLRRICQAGGEVLTVSADVTDREQMTEAVAQAVARFGTVHGILHAAGSAGGQLLALHEQELADATLAPKVRGTLVLDELVAGLPNLELLVLFSSIVAVSADYGVCDYAAANSFLDAYAAAHADGPVRVLSINWWGWREVGMVSETGASAGFRALQRSRAGSRAVPVDHPLLHRATSLGADGWSFEVDLAPDQHWVLTDHRIDGVGVLPGTSLLEMAHAAARHVFGDRPIRIEQVVFIDPVRVVEPTLGRLRLEPGDADDWEFTISFVARADGRSASSRADDETKVHCRGRLRPFDVAAAERIDLAAWQARLAPDDPDQAYSGLVEFGPRFRVVEALHRDGDRGLVELRLPDDIAGEAARYGLHPALLDRAVYGLRGAEGRTYLPFSYRGIEVWQAIPPHCWVVQTYSVDPARPDFIEIDETIVDPDGRVCVVVEGYTLRSVDRDAAGPAAAGVAERRRDAGMLSNAEGGELFRRILASGLGPRVVTSVGSLHDRLEEARAFTAESIGSPVKDGGDDQARTIGTTYVEPETATQRELAQLWGDSLGVARVGIDDDFFLLGGSSLTVVQLAARIRSRLSVELSAADLFEYPTIRQLAELIESGAGDEVG